MSVQLLCDLCTGPVEGKAAERQPEFRLGVIYNESEPKPDVPAKTVEIKIMRAINGTWNGGHICNDCLRLALKRIRRDLKVTR